MTDGGIPTADVNLRDLGYTAQVGGADMVVKIRRSLPWGITKKYATRAQEARTEQSEDMLRRLIRAWNVTPRALGIDEEDAAELGVPDLELDAVPPVPKANPLMVNIVGSDIAIAIMKKFLEHNRVDEVTEGFSRTSSAP